MPTLRLSDGGEMFYEVDDYTDPWKPAETVVLHHAALGSGRRFYAWVPWLARDFRVVRLDARGHGRSSLPPADFQWVKERLTQDIRELLDALDVEKVHLVGSSAGGIISQMFAVEYPERLKTLSLFATKPGMKHSSIDYSTWIKRVGEVGLRQFLLEGIENRFDLGQVQPGFVDWWLDQSAKTPVEVAGRFIPLMATVDTRPLLSRIRVPTLIVAPGDDPLCRPEYLKPLIEDIPGAEVVVFEGARHNITDAMPDRCAKELLRFLKKG